MGRNTATVVNVEAMTAGPTSTVPSTAAVTSGRPVCLRRNIDSSTTMELSTSMPIPKVSPPSDMMFSEIPIRYISTKVAMTDSGILVAMISVDRRSRKNASRTRIASTPPINAALRTSLTPCSMKCD